VGQPHGMNGAQPIAALPMYDFDWIAGANDALWAAIAGRLAEAGVESPRRLTRVADHAAQWRDPGLVFGQTCGYPYVTALRDAVALIATPEYAFPGCEGASHRSFLVRRAIDPRRALAEFRGARAAINGWDSNTGMNLFRLAIASVAHGAPFFGAVAATGAHEASLARVANGEADLASIDCISFAHISRGRPALVERVAVVAESGLSPGLPFIVSARLRASTIDTIRLALTDALAEPGLCEALTALGLKGARETTPADYERVAEIEREAEAAGYPRLA
jgi:ABC-type phosphate/phosphonate transport system substrate-binding protein